MGKMLQVRKVKCSRFKVRCLAAGLVVLTMTGGDGVRADDSRVSLANEHSIGLIAASRDGMGDALTMADRADHIEGLRILPIAGRGSLQSLNDLLFLTSVDAAIVSSDSLVFAQQNGLYENETERLFYLAKLDSAPIVVLARKDITQLDDLRDKQVATGTAESDSYVAALLILNQRGLSYERVALGGDQALAALEAGQIDAGFFSGSEARKILKKAGAETGLHILALPYDEKTEQAYAPALLTPSDSPGLLKEGEVVETVAAAKILAVAQWPEKFQHQARITRFNNALMQGYYETIAAQGTVNLSAQVPGWQRFDPPPLEALLPSDTHQPERQVAQEVQP